MKMNIELNDSLLVRHASSLQMISRLHIRVESDVHL